MKPLIRVFEYLKFQGFWAMDFIRGSKISKHLKDIKIILDSKDTEQVNAIRKNHLEGLLQHAVKTTAFYNRFNQVTDCLLSQ